VHRSRNISWIPQCKKENWDYLSSVQRGKWEEWRADWCWIQDKEVPKFYREWTKCVVRSSEWSELGLSDEKLRPDLHRILCLKAAQLTTAHVGANFLRRRIVPLQ
jgi:hypothetical protein